MNYILGLAINVMTVTYFYQIKELNSFAYDEKWWNNWSINSKTQSIPTKISFLESSLGLPIPTSKHCLSQWLWSRISSWSRLGHIWLRSIRSDTFRQQLAWSTCIIKQTNRRKILIFAVWVGSLYETILRTHGMFVLRGTAVIWIVIDKYCFIE